MQHWGLMLAGLIGGTTAIVHGILTQRLMVVPVTAIVSRNVPGAAAVPQSIRRLIPPLLQYSTFSWLLGGLALVAVAVGGGAEARLWTGLLVGCMFLFGAVANAWERADVIRAGS